MLRPRLPVACIVSLMVTVTLFVDAGDSRAQEQTETAPDSPVEKLLKVEADIEILRSHPIFIDVNVSHRAWDTLKAVSGSDLSDDVKSRIHADRIFLEEILGRQNLRVAECFLGRSSADNHGARLRLLQIVDEYPDFSRMDEVLLDLSEVSVLSESPNQARDYLWKLICKYPDTAQTSKAFARLNEIGWGGWQGCDKYQQ